MVRVPGKNPVIVSLVIIAIGLLIASFVFVYYGFDLGIKPCEGLPSDAANCGDADLGGIVFVMAGVPIVAFGIISLVAALLLQLFKPDFNRGRFLATVYCLLGALVLLLLTVLFV